MRTVHERAKQQFPSVLLTLLSIIQALALEVLWSSVHEHPHLWTWSAAALAGWLQVTIALAGIVLVWVVYVSIVLRVVWVPSIGDTVYPFVIGVLEFVLADRLEPGFLAYWFCLLALLFFVSTWSSTLAFRRASRDPENEELFAVFGRISTRDRLETLGFVAAIALCGVVVHVFGAGGRVAVAMLLVSLGALGLQFRQMWQYWQRTMHAG